MILFSFHITSLSFSKAQILYPGTKTTGPPPRLLGRELGLLYLIHEAQKEAASMVSPLRM